MNKEEKDLGSKLAYAALDDVPTPKSDAREIVGLIKSSGRITGYQLSDGSIVSKERFPGKSRRNPGRWNCPPQGFRIFEIAA